MRGSEAHNAAVAGGNPHTPSCIAAQGNVHRSIRHCHLTIVPRLIEDHLIHQEVLGGGVLRDRIGKNGADFRHGATHHRAGGGATGNPIRASRVDRRAIMEVLAIETVGQLIHVCLAHKACSS